MPTRTDHELVMFHSRFSMTKSSGGFRRVKGFVSFGDPDRHGHEVKPEAFNIPRFMSNPQLLVNHELWNDEHGNKISVGKVVDMFVAEVVEGDEKNFGIKNTETGLIVDSFPKEKAPELRVSQKGLWAIAEVSRDDVWSMVERGELTTFSWRGLAEVRFSIENDELVRKVVSVDLMEVSLVNIPAHQKAIFTIAKAVGSDSGIVGDKNEDVTPLVVQSLIVGSKVANSIDTAKTWLKDRNYSVEVLKECGFGVAAKQHDVDKFDPSSLVSAKIAEGVQAIVGRLKEYDRQLSSQKTNTRLSKSDVEKLIQFWTDGPQQELKNMADQNTTKVEDTKKCGDSASNSTDVATLIAGISKAFQDSVAPLAAKLDGMATMLTDISKGIAAAPKKEEVVDTTKAQSTTEVKSEVKTEAAAKTETKTEEVSKTADAHIDIFKKLEETIQANAKATELLSKSLAGVVSDRGESLEKKASDDPNSCFDSVFGFAAKK